MKLRSVGLSVHGVLVALVASAALAVSAEARAEEQARARLSYVVDAADKGVGAERCPTEDALRDVVGARLGYDPFTPSAEQEVVVRITRRGRGLAGSFEVKGPKPGQREIASPSGDCRELVDALATAIAIRLDPASLGRQDDAPPPLPPPTLPAAPERTDSPPPPPPPVVLPPPPPDADAPGVAERTKPTVFVGLGGAGIFGELPAASAGVALSAELRLRWFGVTLEGEATLPASRASASAGSSGGDKAEVSASLLSGALLPCAHGGFFFGCFVGRLGALRAEGVGVDVPYRKSALFGSIGVRVGAEVPVTGPLSVVASVEGVAPLTRIALELSGSEAWTVPPVGARVALGAKVQF